MTTHETSAEDEGQQRQPVEVTVAAAQRTEEAKSTAGPMAQGNEKQAELQQTFFLQEFASLHDEIAARMGQRGNLFTFTIVTAGTLLSLGASTNAQIALFYPILSLFLAAAWRDEDEKIGALSAYLLSLEQNHNLVGWETYRRRPHRKTRALLTDFQWLYPRSMLSLATQGIFLSTQILAILIGFTQASSHGTLLTTLPLLGVALLATVITVFVSRHQRNYQASSEVQEH